MNISVVFAKMKLTLLDEKSVGEFKENIKSAACGAFGTDTAQVEVLQGESDNPQIDVYVNISGLGSGARKKIALSAFSSRAKKYINLLQSKAGAEYVSKKDNIYICENEKLPLSNSDCDDEFDYAARARFYNCIEPKFDFSRVILSEITHNDIMEAAQAVKYRDKVYNEWGLSSIASPCVALNFFGPSGTGKTMAAQAFAKLAGKRLIKASYADIESKYHGEGPKMVKALFMAAKEQDAVIFIDEADSLLSRRLTDVTQGSEQAINSMRSQLLISLEDFDGIVIFATNLIDNYDKAFVSRLNCIEFAMPDEAARKKIWDVHIKPCGGNGLRIPLADDVDTNLLAKKFELCGRDIREAVKYACVRAAASGCEKVSLAHFEAGCNTVVRKNGAVAASCAG